MTEIDLLALAADGQLPEWIRVLPLGRVNLAYGRGGFEVDQAAMETIVQEFKNRGLDLVIDYEHQSLAGDRPSSRDEGLRLLHGLATKLATSLQTPQEA